MFKCEKCGNCCRNLSKSSLYADLDRGDGICRFLDGNLCLIYEVRPLKCRIDECYDRYFSKFYSQEEYYRLNREACQILQSKKK